MLLILQAPMLCSYHQDVSDCLARMSIPHAMEFSSPDGQMSVDIVTRCGDGSPLAMEVDGQSHFTALPPYRPLGHTVLRNILITAAGFKGVSIAFYDWNELKDDGERVQFLASKLADFGIVSVENPES